MARSKSHRAWLIVRILAISVFGQTSSARAEPGVTTYFGNSTSIAPLIEAAAFGQANRIAELLATTHDVDAVDTYGNSALSVAALRGHVAITKLLIEAGASVDLPNKRLETPITNAAAQGHTTIVRLLGKKSTMIDRQTISGLSPLALAAMRCHDGAVAELIKSGADILIPSGKERHSPLMIASQHCDEKTIFVILTSHSTRAAAIAARDIKGRTALWHAANTGNIAAIAALLPPGASVNAADAAGETPLHRAVAHPAAVTFLLSKGAAAGTPSSDGTTPLMRAAAGGPPGVVAALLKHGAAVNVRNQHGQTALMIAASAGRAQAIQLLLDAGADRSLRNIRRESAVEIATKNGHQDIASALR